MNYESKPEKVKCPLCPKVYHNEVVELHGRLADRFVFYLCKN